MAAFFVIAAYPEKQKDHDAGAELLLKSCVLTTFDSM